MKKYQPEQLLLDKAKASPGVKQFAESGYALVYEDSRLSLYVVRSLAGK